VRLFPAHRLWPAGGLIAALLAACGGGDGMGPGPQIIERVEISGAQSIAVGATVQLTARVLDQNNNVLVRTITWSSSNPAIASVVPNTGLVTGHAVGSVTITATSGTNTAGANIPVTAILAISGVTPAVLRAGEAGTINGSGFSPDILSNTVTLSGERVNVTAATGTSLQITVPASVCLPTGPAVIRVTVAGQASNSFGHPFEGAGTPLNVPLGQQVLITNPANFCLRFAAATGNESYLVGVQSIAEDVRTVTSVRVNGAAAAGQAPPPATVQRSIATGPFSLNLSSLFMSPRARRLALHRAAEMETRLSEAQWQRFKGVPHYPQSQLAAASIPANVAVGDTLTIRVPKRVNGCTQFTEIRAVARVIGTRGVWLDDVQNPVNGLTLTDFQNASMLLDNEIYATNTGHFGNLSDLDGNGGRIAMLVTKEVNRDGNALGTVHSADFFPRTGTNSCPSSNFGETMYIRAPDPNGVFGEAFPADVARDELFITVAHEMVHIIQFGRRITNPNAQSFPTPWELEGQALIGEEINGHAKTGRSTGQNYGFSVAFAGTGLQDVDNDPYPFYFDKFFDLIFYYGLQCSGASCDQVNQVLGAPEQCSWLALAEFGNDGPCDEWRPIYGVPWLLLRWMSDQFSSRFATGEPGLQRALIDHTQDGFETLATVAGIPISELLAQWSAALYVDDRVPTAAARLTVPSWNLVSVEVELIRTAHLTPRARSFTTFTDDVQVRGASTAYFRVTGTRPAFTLGARTSAGGTLPNHMQMWVVRLE
jgi:hypothetical protein